MNFLTLQPEQYLTIATRNVLPIQDYPRYVSNDKQTITASVSSSYSFTFPVIQLNQVPDTLIMFVRPKKALQQAVLMLFLIMVILLNHNIML